MRPWWHGESARFSLSNFVVRSLRKTPSMVFSTTKLAEADKIIEYNDGVHLQRDAAKAKRRRHHQSCWRSRQETFFGAHIGSEAIIRASVFSQEPAHKGQLTHPAQRTAKVGRHPSKTEATCSAGAQQLWVRTLGEGRDCVQYEIPHVERLHRPFRCGRAVTLRADSDDRDRAEASEVHGSLEPKIYGLQPPDRTWPAVCIIPCMPCSDAFLTMVARGVAPTGCQRNARSL